MALSPELEDQLRNLSPDQKREALRILWDEPQSEDEIGLQFNKAYEVWMPVESGNAISVLKKMLEDDKDA